MVREVLVYQNSSWKVSDWTDQGQTCGFQENLICAWWTLERLTSKVENIRMYRRRRNIETLDSRRVWCHFSSWSESMDSYRHLWLRLKLYDLRVFSRDEAVGQKLKMPTLSGHPPPLSPFRYSFCLEYFKKVYLVHEWTHLPTAFVICPLWSSANKVFSTCHPARLKSTSQMYSLGTQMHYFPFSAII